MANHGEYLHELEDSFSHQTDLLRPDFSTTYGTTIGQGLHLHYPDWTWRRPELAISMAEETFIRLRSLCRAAAAGECDSAVGWSDIQKDVVAFIEGRPALTWEIQFGTVPVPNVRDYTKRIKKLDDRFELAPEERRARDDAYAGWLEYRAGLRESLAKRLRSFAQCSWGLD